MNDLPRNVEAIIAENTIGCAEHVCDRVRNAVSSTYALACKPVRELTDADCMEIWERVWQGKFDSQVCQSSVEVVRNLAALINAKQREPEVVEFRAARSKVDGKPMVFEASANLELTIWEWLEPAQTFKVVLS